MPPKKIVANAVYDKINKYDLHVITAIAKQCNEKYMKLIECENICEYSKGLVFALENKNQYLQFIQHLNTKRKNLPPEFYNNINKVIKSRIQHLDQYITKMKKVGYNIKDIKIPQTHFNIPSKIEEPPAKVSNAKNNPYSNTNHQSNNIPFENPFLSRPADNQYNPFK